jgi:putative ABC transport system permease protein
MAWQARLWNVFRANRLNQEIDAELEFHLAETVDRLIAEGLPAEQARYQARRQLGNYTLQKERVRNMDIMESLDKLRSDIAYGLRQLVLNPGFAGVAILSLALGIGANTAIFQLLDAIRLSGLPVENPSQLVTVVPGGNPNDFFIAGSYSSREQAFTYAQMDELRQHQEAFSSMLLFYPTRFDLSTSGRSRYAETLLVSGNYLKVLGIKPLLGSGPQTQDDKIACTGTPAVLSYSFWQKEFGGDANAIGKSVSLNGRTFPVGGVTPPTFFGIEPGQRFDVMLPLCADNVFAPTGKGRSYDRMSFWLTPIARLKPGWSVERASQHIAQLSPVIFKNTVPVEYRPDFAKLYLKNKLKVISASAGVSALRTQYADPLWILMAITGSVLLIACANLANLLLARASAREKEIAVRQALGASRSRLITQLLTESLLLSLAGAALGIALAQILSRALILFLSGNSNSIAIPTGLNWHLIGFLGAVVVLTCTLFGLAPALRASARKPASAMHGGRSSTASRERNGLRRVLVTVQVALSLVLTVAALLFSTSLRNLLSTSVGFDSSHIVAVSLTANGPGFESTDKRAAVFRRINEQIRSMGQVTSAAATAFAPFSGFGWRQPLHADSDHAASGGKASYFNRVGPGYFTTMGTPQLAGRQFTAHDDLNAPKVAIVNQSFAKHFFSGHNPVGHTIRLEGQEGQQDDVYQIVGLVADTKYNDLREPEPDTVFFSTDQENHLGNGATIVLRWRGSLESLMSGVQQETAKINPNVLLDFHVLSTQIKQSVQRESLMANLSVAFGFLAAGLSTSGLYGVMSYIVARRSSEIGIRLALGATRRSVYSLVAKDAATMIAAGLILGLIASLCLSRYAQSLLFGLKPTDPLTLLLAGGLLVGTGIVATLTPAVRASRLDPTLAFRNE